MLNKKVIFEPGMQVRFTEVEESLSVQSANEVLVKNLCSHVSAGTELACLAGKEGWFPLPGTPGYTSIGQVLEVGRAVTTHQPGDLVYTFGPHAAHYVIDTTDRWHGVCVPVPQDTPLTHAAFTHMAGIAMTAIRKSDIELGDWVAVAGMGSIGNLAAQLAQLQGANVIGLDVNEQRLSIARACGIEHTANPAGKDLKELLLELTGGAGVSTFIDATGSSPLISAAAGCISMYGELILLGSPRDPWQTNITPFLQHIHLLSEGAITVKGALEFVAPTHSTEFVKHSIERNSQIILRLIQKGKLRIAPLLTHVLPPEQATQAYKGLQDAPDQYVGVVFVWD